MVNWKKCIRNCANDMKTYKNLLALELKLFFSKKNIFIILGGVIAIAAFCHFYFIPKYNGYMGVLAHSFEVQNIYANVQSDYDKDEIKTFEAGNDDPKELEKKLGYSLNTLKMVVECWGNYVQELQKLQYFMKQDKVDYDRVLKIKTRMDYERATHTKYKDALFRQHYYGDTYEDFLKEVAVHKAYDEAGKKEILNKCTPNGAYMFLQTFSGNGFIILAFIIFLFMLNYDAWCNEFENKTYAQTFTLPYDRRSIITIRWISRVVLTNVLVILYALEFLAIGALKYGTGLGEYVAILKNGKYVGITQGAMMGKNLIYLMFLCAFAVTFILLVSVILKNSVNALTVVFFCVSMYAMRSIDYSKYHPYALLNMSKLMQNESAISIRMAIMACILYSVVMFVGMTAILMRREE